METNGRKVYVDDVLICTKKGHDYENKFLKIKFQDGAVNEVNEVNGTSNETILKILIDRLQYFQEEHEGGKFKCRENALALTKVEEALLWLQYRTQKRIAQGVEGLNIVHK